MTPPVVLTIAGSDCSGGAGIQADLKTFHQHGVYGCSVLTLVTAQNTAGVQSVTHLEPSVVRAQLRSVLSDLDVRVIKIGALGTEGVVLTVAEILSEYPDISVILDSVIASKRGRMLLQPKALDVFREQLIPRALLLTPNRDEAAILSGLAEVQDSGPGRDLAAARLLAMGCKSVLMKGGHFVGPFSTDVLYVSGGGVEFSSRRQQSANTHGTGCTLASAIAANLALNYQLTESVARAHGYVQRAIATGPGCLSNTPDGNGPLNHFAPPE